MPNRNTFWNRHTRRKIVYADHTESTRDFLVWVENQDVCLVCPSPCFLSLLHSLFFGHHGWTDKHVIVTAEVVNTNTDKTQPRVIAGFQGALTKTHAHTHTRTKKDSGTKTRILCIKNSLWVGLSSVGTLRQGEKMRAQRIFWQPMASVYLNTVVHNSTL